MTTPDVIDDVKRYLETAGEAVSVFSKVRDFFAAHPRVKARRLRRHAAFLLARANRVQKREHFLHAADLRRRARLAWAEAQSLDPIAAELAAQLDRTAG